MEFIPQIHDVGGCAATVCKKRLPADVGLLDTPSPFLQVCLSHAKEIAPGDNLEVHVTSSQKKGRVS